MHFLARFEFDDGRRVSAAALHWLLVLLVLAIYPVVGAKPSEAATTCQGVASGGVELKELSSEPYNTRYEIGTLPNDKTCVRKTNGFDGIRNSNAHIISVARIELGGRSDAIAMKSNHWKTGQTVADLISFTSGSCTVLSGSVNLFGWSGFYFSNCEANTRATVPLFQNNVGINSFSFDSRHGDVELTFNRNGRLHTAVVNAEMAARVRLEPSVSPGSPGAGVNGRPLVERRLRQDEQTRIPLSFTVTPSARLATAAAASEDEPTLSVTDFSVESGARDVVLRVDGPDDAYVAYRWVEVTDMSGAVEKTPATVAITDDDSADSRASFHAPDVSTDTPLYFKVTATNRDGGQDSAVLTVTVRDRAPPEISVSATPDPARGGEQVTLTVSSAATDIASYSWRQIAGTDVTGSWQGSGSDTVRFDAPTSVEEMLQFEVTVTDVSNNEVTSPVEVSIDNERPTVKFIEKPETLTSLLPFKVVVEFSEPVTGFTVDGFDATNAEIRDFLVVDEQTYAVVFEPTGIEDITLNVLPYQATDLAGHRNLAASAVIKAPDSVAITVPAIRNYLSNRRNQIMTNKLDVKQKLMSGGAGGEPMTFNADGTFDNQNINYSGSLSALRAKRLPHPATGVLMPEFDVWMKGRFARVSNQTQRTNLFMGSFGADYRFNDDVLAGMLIELDYSSHESTVTPLTIDGLGWLVGPYMAVRLHEHLILDGRIERGESYNSINPLGTYEDEFETTRWMVRGGLTGDFRSGAWRFAPGVELVYFREEMSAYVDSLGNTIGSMKFSKGNLIFGPEIGYDTKHENGMSMSSSLSLDGVWDFDMFDNGQASDDSLRARIEASFGLRMPVGWSIDVSAYYDGVGTGGADAQGGSIQVTVPF